MHVHVCNVSCSHVLASSAAIETEIAVMKALHHPNIVRYLGVHRDATTLSVLMEYQSGGSLADMIARFG